MAKPEAFDPTHALDGWRLPAPAPSQDVAWSVLREAGVAGPGEARIQLISAEPEAFDPEHLLDGWRPPAPGPLDLDLTSLLRTGGARPDEAKKARLKARGYEMRDVEDIELPETPVLPKARVPDVPPAAPPPEAASLAPEPAWPAFTGEAQILQGDTAPPAPPEAAALPEEPPPAADAEAPWLDLQIEVPAAAPAAMEAPELDFQVPPPLVAPDPQQVLDDIQLPPSPPPAEVEAPVLDLRVAPPAPEPDPQQVIDAVELPEVAPPPAFGEAPVLETRAPAPSADPDPRWVADWQPQAWTAMARRVVNARTEVLQTGEGPRVVSHVPQWLCALWPPQAAEPMLLRRWPDMVALASGETRAEALQTLLDELPAEAVLWAADLEADWRLVAELALDQAIGLPPAQARGLRHLIEAELGANQARREAYYQFQGRVVRRRA